MTPGHECVDYTSLVSKGITSREREVVAGGLPVVKRDRFLVGLVALFAALLIDVFVFLVSRILLALPVLSYIPFNLVLFAMLLFPPVAVMLSGRLIRRRESGVTAWKESRTKRRTPGPGTLWVGITPLSLPPAGTLIQIQMRTVRTKDLH